MEEEIKREEDTPSPNTKAKLEEMFTESTISYTVAPGVVDESDTVCIMGEFNNWIPEGMERRSSDTSSAQHHEFFYKVKLLKGYKYRYIFMVG